MPTGSTYGNDPENDDGDAVRLECGDTTGVEWLLTDAEIDYCIAREANVTSAAARACDLIAAEFSREVTMRAGAGGEFQIRAEQAAIGYRQKAVDLRARAVLYTTPYAGGISISDKNAEEERTDRVEPAFSRDQFKNVSTSEGVTEDWNTDGAR